MNLSLNQGRSGYRLRKVSQWFGPSPFMSATSDRWSAAVGGPFALRHFFSFVFETTYLKKTTTTTLLNGYDDILVRKKSISHL